MSFVRRLCVAAAVLVSIPLLSACNPSGYAAQGKHFTVSNRDFLDLLGVYARGGGENAKTIGQGPDSIRSSAAGELLRLQVAFAVLDDLVRKEKITITPADEDSAQTQAANEAGTKEILAALPKAQRDHILRGWSQFAAYSRVHTKPPEPAVVPEPTDAEIQQVYDANAAALTLPCVHHILVKTIEEATAVKAELATTDFATEAKAKSIDTQDPGSGASGGDLGCLTTAGSRFGDAFDSAARSQAIGVVGDPVETDFGVHLIRVDSRAPAPLDDALRQRIIAFVKQQQQSRQPPAAGTPDLSGLFAAIDAEGVTVDPRYGTWVQDPSGFGVRPPPAPSTAGDQIPVPADGSGTPGGGTPGGTGSGGSGVDGSSPTTGTDG